MQKPSKSSWVSNAFLLLLAVAVAYLIYGLAAENRQLKATIAQMQQGGVTDGLVAGEPLAEVEVRSLEGRTATLAGLVDDGGVVVFLTTTCPFCKQTLPTWGRLAETYAARGRPFVGVSFHDEAATRAYAEAEGITFPLWVLADPTAAPEVRVPSVPFTALVGPEGTVRRAWLGVLDDGAEEDLLTDLDREPLASR